MRSKFVHNSCIVILFLFALTLLPNSNVGILASSVNSSNHPEIRMATASKAINVAAGGNHSCLITDTGGVKCWGDNSVGQLGDGTKVQRSTPVDVTGLASGVSSIATGGTHTCILTSGGGVKCWGGNWYGEVGDGTTIQKSVPVNVVGLGSGVVKITAKGENFGARTCALTTSGGVKCWGREPLGNGTDNPSSTPVNVSGLGSGVIDVQAGHDFACALTTSGSVKCWGRNYYGQLGNGTLTDSLVPVDVTGLASGAEKITVGYNHACALLPGRHIKCWGMNTHGELGDGTAVTDPPYAKLTPVEVVGLLDGTVIALAAGSQRTCALIRYIRDNNSTNTYAKCWGWNGVGALGDYTIIDKFSPVDVIGLEQVSGISVGLEHTCALTTEGKVLCWGHDSNGQLGLGTITIQPAPLSVNGLVSGVFQVSAGIISSCALTTGGGVKCWGMMVNDNGSLALASAPTDIAGLTSGVKAVTVGAGFACALTNGGGVKCWGYNAFGNLGDGTTINSSAPVDVIGLTSGVEAISAMNGHVCALTEAGGVKCWGWNNEGELGDRSNINRSSPVDVFGLTTGVSAISAGSDHTCALTNSGGMKCWGENRAGNLGDGTGISTNYPVNVTGLTSGVKAIAAGGLTCAILTTNGLKCWGNNIMGGVGDGTNNNVRLTPVDVSGLTSGVSGVSIGAYHTCATLSTGGVKCWGGNYYGQVGDGTLGNRSLPVEVRGLTTGVVSVVAGWEHSCALTTQDGVKCWGSDSYGQLGQGTIIQRVVPLEVVGFGGIAYSISGRVTDNSSNPMSGVVVMAGPTGFANTDSNGSYGILLPKNLSAGNYSVSASFPGYMFTLPHNVTVPPPAIDRNFTGSIVGSDITPPDGVIQSPSNGDQVTSSGLNISAAALDNPGGSGVARVEFYARYDGKWHLLGSITSEPYQVMWTPAEDLRTQLVTLSIYVYDNAGNITRDAGGQKQVSFVLDGQVLINTRFYLNQRALGVNGDEMCSMSSIAMILASAGKIQSDYPSLRDAANEAYKTLRAPGAQRVADYLNTEALGMNASIVWSQDKEIQWTHITGEINVGRPLILSNPRNGGTVTQWGHYMVIVGFVESSIPSLRQIIVYDPYGAWRGSLNSYDRNSASPDPPEGVKGRQVIYNWSSFGTTYLIETHPLNGNATTPLDTTLPDEVFILDTPDIVTYLGHGESPYPFQLFLPEITR